jgi:F-type H+-transporting ATPase subunit a
MITGHILAKVCVGFIWVAYLKGTSLLVLTLPLLLLTLFLGLELLIAYLQAYIFTFITCITIKDMAFTFWLLFLINWFSLDPYCYSW